MPPPGVVVFLENGNSGQFKTTSLPENDFDPSPKPTTFFVTTHHTPFWTLPSPKTQLYAQIHGHLWPTSYAVSGFLFNVSLASLSNNSLSVNGETLSTILVHKMIHGISSIFTMNHYDTLTDVSLLICRDSIAVAITMTPSQGHFVKPNNPKTCCSLSVKMNSYTTLWPCLNMRGGASLPTIFGMHKEDNPSWLMKHGPCSRKGILMQRSITTMMDDIGPFREMKMTCDTMMMKKFNEVLSFTLFPAESLLRSLLDNIQKPLTISIPFKTFNYPPTFLFTCLPTMHPYQTILFITTHSPRTYYELKTILPTSYGQHLMNLAHTNGQVYLCRKLR